MSQCFKEFLNSFGQAILPIMQKVRRHTLLLRKVVFRLLIELLIHDLFHHSPFSKYKYKYL